MRGPSTITREVAEPSLCNVPKKSRRVPRSVNMDNPRESHLQLTNSRLGGCCFPTSRHHAQNEGKSPVRPPLSSQISPAARPDLDLCHSTPLTQTAQDSFKRMAIKSTNCHKSSQPAHGTKPSFQLEQAKLRLSFSWESQGF